MSISVVLFDLDDTLPMLDVLSNFRLGIITNGEPDFQQRKLDQVGLTDRFEHVIASGSLDEVADLL